MNTNRRICLWAGPRYGATPLMYAFGQRADTAILDEPLYGHYLHRSGVVHPGREQVLQHSELDPNSAIWHMLDPSNRPILFIKNMAHHLIGLEVHFLDQLTNVILIRHPRQVLASLSRYLAEPTLLDTAYEMLLRLYTYLDRQGIPPLIIQSEKLVQQPEAVLRQVCAYGHIPFDPGMLGWQPGGLQQEGIWSDYWYQSARESSGFCAQPLSYASLPLHLAPLLAQCMPYYEQLREISWQQAAPAVPR